MVRTNFLTTEDRVMSNKYLSKLASLSEVVTPDEAINAMQYSHDPRLRRAYMDIDTYRRNPTTRYSVSGSMSNGGASFSVDPELTPFEEYGHWYEGLPTSREDAQRRIDVAAEKAKIPYALHGLGIGGGVGAGVGALLGKGARLRKAGIGALVGGAAGALVGAGRSKGYRDENTRALLYLKALELRDRNR